MRTILRLLLCTTGAYIVACAGCAEIKGISAIAIELQREQQTEKIVPPRVPSPRVITPQTVKPARTPAQGLAPDHGASTVATPPVAGPKFVVPGGTETNTSSGAAGATVTAPNMTAPSVSGSRTVQTFTPHGANAGIVTMSRLGDVPAIGVSVASIRGQNYSVWRHGYHAHYHDRLYTCVALSALPAILIGANEFYPFAYIDAPEPYCDGLTEDGCQLAWQNVETDEGDVIPQCVAYCPWQR
jgi:hypothetical protein